MEERINRWLSLMGGPGYEGADSRARAIAQMRAAGTDGVFSLLTAKLADSDLEIRCRAITAILFLDPRRAIELVLPLLRDSETVVRWHACGCLHDFWDKRAVDPLIATLQGDPDPQVRGTAAYALGGIGSPAAIPALWQALESDHEVDILGHSASSSAAGALDDILGTNETRIRVSESTMKLPPGKPDLARLKQMAEAYYQAWSAAPG